MLNLIKLEFYKLRKQRIFKVLLLAVIAISAFSAFAEIRNSAADNLLMSGKTSYANAFKDIFMIFISGIFAGFYIGSDFSNKTIQSQLSQGHSRLNIVISKAIVFFIGTSIIMLLYPMTACIINTIKFGWGEPFTITSILYILRVAVLGILLNIGTTSISVLFGFWCRDIPKTICVCLAFPILFSLLGSTLGNAVPIIGKIMNFTTLAQLGNIVGNSISPAAIMVVLLSSAITVTVIISLSNLMFAKAEIK